MANENVFTEAQQHDFQQALLQELKTNAGAKDIFCTSWEAAKTLLQLILKIKNLPAIVITVINAIIKAGDLAFAALCKKSAG